MPPITAASRHFYKSGITDVEHHFFNLPIPPILTNYFCPSWHISHNMMPKKVAVYRAEAELVSLSTVYDLLDEQQLYYKELIHQQERNYRAFLQMLMDTSSSRMDNLFREMQDLGNCLQRTKEELAEVKKQGIQNCKRAECLAEGLLTVREVLDGHGMKTGIIGGEGRGVDLKQRRGGGGRRGGGIEPKAVKLVAGLTDIHFNIKVVLGSKDYSKWFCGLLVFQNIFLSMHD